ncbi:N-acetylmuramoyl-L-alanine amidase [Psychroserpens sp. MEBiC05023]
MIDYMFYTLVSLGGSYLVYHFVLKKQKTFQFNRGFLIVTLLLCLIAPILEIELFETVPSITEISIQPSDDDVISHQVMNGVSVTEIKRPSYTFYDIIWYIYLGISVCFAIRFFRNLITIFKLTQRQYSEINGLRVIKTNDNKNVSSFFNFLFVNSDSLDDENYSKLMLQHELIHYKQKHSLDILITEIIICILWFNPFVWLYRNVIVQNHEFIADSYTVQSGIDINNYSQTIISSGLTEHRIPLSSGFNFIQIKNRIIMLHQSKSTVLKRSLKITFALLLFSGVFIFSSFKSLNKPIIVVVDAAHGGKDSGHQNEKDIVLNISNALAQLSDDKVKIITLRDKDEFFSLKDRVRFVNELQPDFLLSLHCNAAPKPDANGVEIFVTDNSKHQLVSFGYGWLLLDEQLNSKIIDKGDMKTASFKILKDIDCPAVVMELGFLTNDIDKTRLNDLEHQNDIAKGLYDGLFKASKIKTRF